MNTEALSIVGSWRIQSQVFSDSRGTFSEWYKSSALTQLTGEQFTPAQANVSVSHAGVIRGIHYSLAPKGQAKLVTVLRGSIVDYVVDIRVGSPTFGQTTSVKMSAEDGQAVFLRHDLAHAFQALEDNTTVSYLVSSEYSPTQEHEITPLCPEININWSTEIPMILSEKDKTAPVLSERKRMGLLPIFNPDSV